MNRPATTTLPPLVEPAGELIAAEAERYSRHVIIPEIGDLGQRRLKNARVLVIGAGGLGSPVLLYLAAAGIGTIGIVDDDTVDVSNLQRQIIHQVSGIGESKVSSAVRAVTELNPTVTVHSHNVRLDSSTALEMIAGYDLLIDGSDNFATRYLVNDAAAILGKPYVWGSVFRFEGQVSVFWERHGPTYRDLFPEAPPAGASLSCGEVGVLGMLCGVIGSMMVAEAVKLITGVGETLLGRVLLFDSRNASWREWSVQKDSSVLPITELVDYELFCGTGERPSSGVDQIGAHQLAARLTQRKTGDANFDLIDVREQGERNIVAIPGSRLVTLDHILSGQALSELPRDTDLILYCKTGTRSAIALAELNRHGYTRVTHLAGGVLSWIQDIEPARPGY
ncbi:molybdopterin-synthase adenylyltransferase MoeB [Subtercola vilae]|uniref:Molybdopterin-synthase adenylyltransferase MoeB n=1 Tax=Subtercola vilae TaxID=2056433 RepID=A0A4T2BXF0_9MICO|nr:molybdopterin-synthase adenylyltransferase MoeB [Subtercola vilae]TIH36180.1 molybdopterin-synthase adenylyltransferase MoeB [Subtercola vilae]